MIWMETTRRAARRSARAVAARCAPSSCSGMNYGPGPRSARRSSTQRDRGAISVYAQGDDYHELIKPRLKDAGALADRAGRRRREGVRRHRRRDGEAARRSAPASAGRASTPIWCRANSARGCFSARSSPRSNCRRTTPSRTTAAPAAPASTSARPRRFPRRTGSMRGAASRISPSSTKARSRASCAPLMGNRIYGCDDCLAVCPWNKFAQAGPRSQARRARDAARAGACRAGAARRRGVPRAVRQDRGEAHRPRPLRAQCADRDRQFRRSVARAGGRAAARRRLAAGARRRGVGARPARSRAARRRSRPRAPASPMPRVAEEWAAATGRDSGCGAC